MMPPFYATSSRIAMSFWDQRFAEPGYKYGLEPNAFLQQHASRLAPRSRVLLPGDGEGRNGVWLAQQGHQVTSVDLSAVGLQKASALAAERGVSLTTLQVDLADWCPEPDSFDAIVLIFTHLPEHMRATAHHRLALGLRSGGLLLLEAFHTDQLQHSSGGPKDRSMLYTPDLLAADFAGQLMPELSWAGEVTLSEGPGHQGLACVTRWIGYKL